MKLTTTTTATLFLSVLVNAQPLSKSDDKILPSGFRVHDLKVPAPKKIEQVAPVSIQAPSDAKVLFDGSNTDAWKGNWKVKDGIMTASPGNLVTKESFGKVQLHLEFRIPKENKVSGQRGANSGIFFLGAYEIQIQESYQNMTYPDGQAAALYGQYPPLVNASTPQGEWQSYDLFFDPPVYREGTIVEPAKLTAIHNGVCVHHAVPFIGTTTHNKVAKYPKEGKTRGPILLQWHQDKIDFRNIWVRDLGDYPTR